MSDVRRWPASSVVATRRPYLDLLRVLAIGAVVAGHWLLIDISYRNGRLSGHDALEAIPWAGFDAPMGASPGVTGQRGVSLRAAVLLLTGGAVLFGVLVLWGVFPPDLIGARNTGPPSIALLAFAATQTGLVLLVEPAATRLLHRGNPGRRLERLNASVMTVYLWHMAPVVLVATAVYPRVPLPQPVIGSAAWWVLRPLWVAVLGALLVPMTLVVDHLQRRLVPGRAPTVRMGGRPLLVALGLGAVGWSLARLAIAGAAPDGRLALGVVVVFAVGVVLVEAAVPHPFRVLPGGGVTRTPARDRW